MSARLELMYFRHWTRNTLIVVWSMTVLCFTTDTLGGKFTVLNLILSAD